MSGLYRWPIGHQIRSVVHEMSTKETENEPVNTEPSDDKVRLSHMMGFSAPPDKYNPAGGEEDRSNRELEALGVEPDATPGWGMVSVFVGLVVGLALLGASLVAGFHWVNQRAQAARHGETVDARLVEVQRAAAAVLAATERVEFAEEPGRPAEYRTPIATGIQLVASRPELLAGHPFGGEAVDPPTPNPLDANSHLPPEPSIEEVPAAVVEAEGSGAVVLDLAAPATGATTDGETVPAPAAPPAPAPVDGTPDPTADPAQAPPQ